MKSQRLDACHSPIKLHEARDFVRFHFDQPLNLAYLADLAGCSPYHFLREYSNAFGETPHQAIVRQRIKRAEELLRLRSITVQEVCIEVGFASLSSFTHLFKREVGRTPAEFRKVFTCAQMYALKVIPACYWVRQVN